jgi:predicted ester cyclase
VIDEVVHDDFVEHEALPPGIPNGKEAPRVLFSMMLAAFPDFRYNVEEILQDGNKVVIRGRFTGTHDGGEFMGIPPTGNRFDAAVIDIMEYAGDKLIGHWGVLDNAAMMQQLGVGEPPG